MVKRRQSYRRIPRKVSFLPRHSASLTLLSNGSARRDEDVRRKAEHTDRTRHNIEVCEYITINALY